MGAARSTFPTKALRPDRLLIAGTFVPNGASAIDNTQNEGAGGTPAVAGGTPAWSVARSAAGQYTVTMADTFNAIENVDAELQSLAAQAVVMQVISKTGNTVVLGAVSAGAFADIAAAAGTKVHFQIVCKNSGLPY